MAETLLRMKKIGNLIVFICLLFVANNTISQCITITELSSLFEDDFSYFNESDYENNGSTDQLNFKGYDLKYTSDYFYFNNGDYLNLNSQDLLMLSVSSSSCYAKIKASVAKESSAKVSAKESTTLNGFEIEKYKHLTKDLIIEFHKKSDENKFFVVLMTTSMSETMSSLIQLKIKRIDDEKRIVEKISNVRKSLSENDIAKAESLLTDAVNYATSNNFNQAYDRELQQLGKDISTIKFNVISQDYLEKLRLNKFPEANLILKRAKNFTDNNLTKQLNQCQLDLNSKAILFYTQNYKQKKELKNFSTALKYLDSIVMFDPNNKWVETDKKELLSINSFLQERKTSEFDFWQFNNGLRETLLRDYKTKIFSLINNKVGIAEFDLIIKTDTSCRIQTSINWKSPSFESITFGKDEQSKYAIKQYEKFGYCGKSSGVLSFYLSWETTSHILKYGHNKVSKYSESNSTVESYLDKKHPLIKGNYKYSKSSIVFNKEKTETIQITDFHTRGPANALFSLVIPGSGSLLVSYGKKGWSRFTWFLISSGVGIGSKYYSNKQYRSYLDATNQTDIDTYYSNANILNKIAIISGGVSVSIYLYDIIWAFSKGCKNIKDSKLIRKQLRKGPVVIQY